MVILGDRTIQYGIVYKFVRSRSTICTLSKKKISDLNFFSNGTWRDHWPHAGTSRRAGGRPSNN